MTATATITVNKEGLEFSAPTALTTSLVQNSSMGYAVFPTYSVQWTGLNLGYTSGYTTPTSGILTGLTVMKQNSELVYSVSSYYQIQPTDVSLSFASLVLLPIVTKDNVQWYGGIDNDKFYFWGNNDSIDGGSGTDSLYLGHEFSAYKFSNLNPQTSFVTVTNVSLNVPINLTSIENFVFTDKTVTFADLAASLTNQPSTISTNSNGNDSITGTDSNDTLDGALGKDTLVGGLGDDTYVVDNKGDKIIEDLDAGTDTVQSSITYILGNNLENLELLGISKINATGNTLDNNLLGNDGNNVLKGMAGDDTLIGGQGSDKLTGGKGTDTFEFSKSDFLTENGNGDLVFNNSVDTISDFHLKENDLLVFDDATLEFYPDLASAKSAESELFYIKGVIYLNVDTTGSNYTPTVIIKLTGNPKVNADFTDFAYPAS